MGNRVTRGANFNMTVPEDVELLNWLDSYGNASDTIRRALRVFHDAGDSGCTDQERSELLTRIAWLEQQLEYAQQNQVAAPAAAPVSVETDQPIAAPAGPELSQVFLAAVKKAARPGLRLNDAASDAAVQQDTALIVERGRAGG